MKEINRNIKQSNEIEIRRNHQRNINEKHRRKHVKRAKRHRRNGVSGRKRIWRRINGENERKRSAASIMAGSEKHEPKAKSIEENGGRQRKLKGEIW